MPSRVDGADLAQEPPLAARQPAWEGVSTPHAPRQEPAEGASDEAPSAWIDQWPDRFETVGPLTLTPGRGPHRTTTPLPATYLAKASTSTETAGTRMMMMNAGMKQKTTGKIIFVASLAAISSTR
jgi:hypothetical protein